jgi:hypothetical protein
MLIQTLHHEYVWERKCIDLCIISLGISLRRVMNFTLWPIYSQGRSQRSVLVKALCYKPEGRGFDNR